MYATPTEALRLVTYSSMTIKVKVTTYTELDYLIRLVSTMCFNSKATPTNNINHSCHIKAIELIWGPYHTTSCHSKLLLGMVHMYIDILQCDKYKQCNVMKL